MTKREREREMLSDSSVTCPIDLLQAVCFIWKHASYAINDSWDGHLNALCFFSGTVLFFFFFPSWIINCKFWSIRFEHSSVLRYAWHNDIFIRLSGMAWEYYQVLMSDYFFFSSSFLFLNLLLFHTLFCNYISAWPLDQWSQSLGEDVKFRIKGQYPLAVSITETFGC